MVGVNVLQTNFNLLTSIGTHMLFGFVKASYEQTISDQFIPGYFNNTQK